MPRIFEKSQKAFHPKVTLPPLKLYFLDKIITKLKKNKNTKSNVCRENIDRRNTYTTFYLSALSNPLSVTRDPTCAARW